MTDTAERNFLGIPITGDVLSERSTPQRSKEEFAMIMQPVLDDPTIVAFGWRQYTPYFNDGDTCYFSAHNPWFYTRPPKVVAVPQRPYEERLIQAVVDQFPFQHILTATNVPLMIAEAFKRVPPVDVGAILAERKERLAKEFAARVHTGAVVVPEYAQQLLAEALEALDVELADPEEEFDRWNIDADEFGFDYGDKHGLGTIKHDGWGVRPDGTRGILNPHYEGPDEERYRHCEALDSAITGGAFNAVLLELFGDHVDITVRTTGISVDEYSHD